MSGKRLFLLVLLIFSSYFLFNKITGIDMRWTKVSSEFMKGNDTQSYGPGDFRIRGEKMVSMKLARPKITFKEPTEAELNDPNYKYTAEVTEPWMKSSSEILNRMNVTFYAGSISNSTQTFHEYAQSRAWWLSPDWKTIYLSTGWLDYHLEPEDFPDNEVPQITKFWRSTDYGHNWEQLTWPEQQNISSMRFINEQEGYLIGWGPRIWRTKNGGKYWHEIQVPAQVKDPQQPRKRFDLVALGKDNALYLAFVPTVGTGLSNEIWRLKRGEEASELIFSVPGNKVDNIFADANGKVYVFTHAGPKYEERNQISTLYQWNGEELNTIHSFPKGMLGYAIYQTPVNKHLLVQGPDYASILPKDWTALSKDGGKTWRTDKNSSSQGGYYDDVTGTDWRVSGYSLYKREIP